MVGAVWGTRWKVWGKRCRYFPCGVSGDTAGRKARSLRRDGAYSAGSRRDNRATGAEECDVSDYTELSTLSWAAITSPNKGGRNAIVHTMG